MNLNVIYDQRLCAGRQVLDRRVLAGGSFAGQSLLLIVTALLKMCIRDSSFSIRWFLPSPISKS